MVNKSNKNVYRQLACTINPYYNSTNVSSLNSPRKHTPLNA